MGAFISKAEFDGLQTSLAHERLQEAGAMADTLLQRYRDPLSERLVKGLMFLSGGNAMQAYTVFAEAVAIAPSDARCYLGVAQSLFQLGHAQKAISAAQAALRCDAAEWQAVLVIADALAALQHWAEAIAQYNRILDMGVSSVFVHLGMGAALVQAGRLADAKEQFAQAIRLEPDRAAGYVNLGHTLMAMGQHEDAIRLYRQALPLTNEIADIIHGKLAHAYYVLGDLANAEAESRRALARNPDLAPAHGVLADILRKLGRHAEAIPHYRKHGTPESAAKVLEDLYHLGDMEAFAAAQAALAEAQPDNIRLAAISALVSSQHGARFASGFCADPLAHIAVSNIAPKLAPFDAFGEQLLREAATLDAVWEPPAKTTKGGFQTEGNLFGLATPAVARLEAVIRDSIAEYFAARAGSRDRYVSHAPKNFTLTGWTVRLRQTGRQDPHIHPDGWLSGVLYLKLPQRAAQEGAIAFTLGGHYFTGEPVAPERVHQPEAGELVLFPSSLFHYTVPFSAEDERISVAFDLMPARN